MTLSELFTEAGYTPSDAFEGVAMGQDYVLAVDCSAEGTGEDPKTFAIATVHAENNNPSLESSTNDANFLYEGKSSTKTDTQRTFNVSAQRMFGDEFQDFVCSHAITYGKGSTVVRPYVYFSLLTGKGEQGKVMISVNNNGGGAAGEPATVDVDLKAQGTPTEYTYAAE